MFCMTKNASNFQNVSFINYLPVPRNASRTLIRCLPRAPYEKKNSHCLLKIRETAQCHKNARLFNTNMWRTRKITDHELTRVLYVIVTSRLCSNELNTMPPRCGYEENQVNIFSMTSTQFREYNTMTARPMSLI